MFPKSIVPIVTPFDEKGDIDEESLCSLLNFIGNISPFSNSYTGEGFVLEKKQKLKVVRIILEEVNSKVSVFPGITGNAKNEKEAAEETADNISEIEKMITELNYDGEIFFVDHPLWYHSNRGLADWYKELGKLTTRQFILYNNPSVIAERRKYLKRRNIRTSVLERLAENEQIIGLKHSGSRKRFDNYCKRIWQKRPDFKMLKGDTLDFLKYPARDGVVAGELNVFPETDLINKPSQSFENIKFFRQSYPKKLISAFKTALKAKGTISTNEVCESIPKVTHYEEKQIYNFILNGALA